MQQQKLIKPIQATLMLTLIANISSNYHQGNYSYYIKDFSMLSMFLWKFFVLNPPPHLEDGHGPPYEQNQTAFCHVWLKLAWCVLMRR